MENQRKIHGQSMDNPVKLFPETNPLMPKIPPLWDDTRCHSPLTTSMKKTQPMARPGHGLYPPAIKRGNGK